MQKAELLDFDKQQLLHLLKFLEQADVSTNEQYVKLIKKYPRKSGRLFSKEDLVGYYRELAGTEGLIPYSDSFIEKIRMKPVRTQSGVAPITVLTKPFPCPGKCIFCPNDIRMPKSYLSDEPGAQRAERNYFDPYLQTYNRLQALHNIGHVVDKAEIIVLGGTWSYYPEKYQIWFIKECFRALNDFGVRDDRLAVEKRYEEMQVELENQLKYGLSNDPLQNDEKLHEHKIDGNLMDKSYNQAVSELYVAPERVGGFDQYQQASWQDLSAEQLENESAAVRSVGLVIETRPDNISEAEVMRVRRLGCTKTQIGVQSLQDDVLEKNKRGHNVAATRRAFRLLRQAGFKIHAHWMANLYGSTVEKDIEDFKQLFSDPDFKPDELKVYPCSLIGSAELMQYYKKGLWKPYSHEELLEVVTSAIKSTPEYCRLTRIIRDIPSTDIVVGNKLTNFRQVAEDSMKAAGEEGQDIRSREIRAQKYVHTDLELKDIVYETSVSTEHFLQFIVKESNQIVAFLRLSLPKEQSFIAELANSAMIREVHVYGELVQLGDRTSARSQHKGLGTELIEYAKGLATEEKFEKISVISAIGTRGYYRKRGFSDGDLYQYSVL
jgi:elongator complex protein 3